MVANSRIGNHRLEIELTGWTDPSRSHIFGIWVLPVGVPSVGELPANIDIQLLGGGTDTLQAVANDLADRIRPAYPSSILMSSFTLYRYSTEFVKDFVSSGLLTVTAAAGGNIQAAQYEIQSFRTAGGSIIKCVFLEGDVAGNTNANLVPNAAGTWDLRFPAWVLSNVSPVTGIDNTFPVAPLKQKRGQMEKTWKTIYRGT